MAQNQEKRDQASVPFKEAGTGDMNVWRMEWVEGGRNERENRLLGISMFYISSF